MAASINRWPCDVVGQVARVTSLGRWTWLRRWAGGPGYVVGQVDLVTPLGRWTWLRRWAGGPVDGVDIGSADAAAAVESTFIADAIVWLRAITRSVIDLGGNREAIQQTKTFLC